MNKEKAINLLNDLDNNIKSNIKLHNNLRFYVQWIFGDIETLKDKINGRFYYPYRATYKQLFYDLKNHIYCKNIDDKIKQEALYFFVNDTNINLLKAIAKTLRIDY